MIRARVAALQSRSASAALESTTALEHVPTMEQATPLEVLEGILWKRNIRGDLSRFVTATRSGAAEIMRVEECAALVRDATTAPQERARHARFVAIDTWADTADGRRAEADVLLAWHAACLDVSQCETVDGLVRMRAVYAELTAEDARWRGARGTALRAAARVCARLFERVWQRRMWLVAVPSS